ncbi:rna-directed dna polymerase from mobile element jockey-like protein, partial [Dinothrombium tinctorium]
NAKDSKKLWKVIKRFFPCSKHNNINFVEYKGGLFTTPIEMAEVINDYSISSIKEINEKLPKIEANFDHINNNGNSFENFKTVSLSELEEVIFSMKNSTPSDDFITAEYLKTFFSTINNTLLDMINSSLITGDFPDILKTSILTPIPKIKNSKKVEELRGIHILSYIEKALERVVYKQVLEHFEENNLLVAEQSGFRKGNSCESSIQLLLHEWLNNIEDNKIILTIFLDFTRAFETIDRKILLKKLNNYGIKGTVLK